MYLTAQELTTYYPKAANMDPGEVQMYLSRANAYANGVIGGIPPVVDDNLKAAVALAFEIMVRGQAAQVDQVTGYVTEIAPTGGYPFQRSQSDPLETVKIMLQPYAMAYDQANAAKSERGVRFL